MTDQRRPGIEAADALLAAGDFNAKTERNARVQDRYDELMREGKHGHYETMFRVVHEEVGRALLAGGDQKAAPTAAPAPSAQPGSSTGAG